ncbi:MULTISPECIES: 2,4'-dihydroxyacetophenone dioxygenase family protein [unclassified Sphingopyxis]|uniref:2,4'-dihydroxyacetophenone dioxygenase family protein n=1 Tax=unclassified Sphingopyxis TaxID=2614943 RepID=UPI00285F0F4C|nr:MULTISPECIES: 2,4'-dihydroxyacetophenone dioxygenase family protein [unclassified Sphingopyxis]MDR6832432.1 anti-sigma factor ChrR (cupin superfamily) [Sphingopyxis sp. BE122]MDR7228175.1 anti-sigma factor ChrR (cupin superfamily) [Sphingopyxis sp. BE259]
MSGTAAIIAKSEKTAVEVTHQHRPAFFNPSALPWADWVMEGTWFKLLNINPVNGGFSMLLKVSASNEAPIHGHFGAVEGFLLEGGFSYDEDRGRVGDYVYEGAGIRHIPKTHEDGMVMFAVVHGPLGGYHEDGTIAAVVDARLMYDLAVAAGAADHIEKPSHW